MAEAGAGSGFGEFEKPIAEAGAGSGFGEVSVPFAFGCLRLPGSAITGCLNTDVMPVAVQCLF